MRQLLLTIILTLFPLTLLAGQQFITLQYKPPHYNKVTLQDSKVCRLYATDASKGLISAAAGNSMDEQLKLWATFALSVKGSQFTHDELAVHRNLIIYAWSVSAKYPDLTPQNFGEYIYNACSDSKSYLLTAI